MLLQSTRQLNAIKSIVGIDAVTKGLVIFFLNEDIMEGRVDGFDVELLV